MPEAFPLPILPLPPRTEFGAERTTCGCPACVLHCRHLSGYLIPADLGRLIPPGADPFAWAEANLMASPGARVVDARSGREHRIPTLVMATRLDGSCVHLTAEGRCAVHADAPFACAFFDCQPADDLALRLRALHAVHDAQARPESLYRRLWEHLAGLGRVVASPEVRRGRLHRAAAWEGIDL